VGLDVPFDRVDRRTRCRATFACVAVMVAQGGGVDQGLRPALGQGWEGRLGRFRGREALSLAV
jgi:hypothetical protein